MSISHLCNVSHEAWPSCDSSFPLQASWGRQGPVGFLERWGALAPLAPLVQQAARASFQTAPKASSTPCSHRRTRTVSVTLEGWVGRAGQNLEGPLPQKDPVKQTVCEWSLGFARRGDRVA